MRAVLKRGTRPTPDWGNASHTRSAADAVPARLVGVISLCGINVFLKYVGNSASTPVPATRNCAVDYCIAASIGVTDIRVQ